MPRSGWIPVWEGPQVVGFKVGNTRVPGAFEIELSNVGIRWRYELGPSSEAAVGPSSNRVRNALAFKTVSNLLCKSFDGVGVSMLNVGGG